MQELKKIPLSFRIIRQLVVVAIFGSLLAVPFSASAQAVVTDPTILAQNLANRAVDAGQSVAKQTLTGSITTFLINLMSYAADKAAYEAAVRVASAGAGGTSLVSQEAWSGYLKDVGASTAGEAVGLLSDEINGPGGVLQSFNLCAPGNADVLLSFKFGVKSVFQPTDVKPKCDINEVAANWKGFVADVSAQVSGGSTDRNQHILTKLADAFDPSTNEFSVGIALSSNIINKSWSDANLAVTKRLAGGGFQDATDFITGQVKTPASLIKGQTENAISQPQQLPSALGASLLSNSDALLQVGVHAGSIFANTLLSKLTEQIFSGLFDVNPALQNTNPFDPSSFAQSNSDATLARLKSIFTATPLEISNYSILAEFGSCPTSNRGLYNCVADSSMISAIAQASTGVPETVQQALDDGLLKGSWPLIPSSDHARNQDPFCYTYGYCYSNLVKLREARVLSDGWEFAANSIYNDQNDPATLSKVVAGFSDCNDADQPDENHPWCKLIDPDWVLKYPATQCRAAVNGQLLSSSASNERQTECVDMPSCIAEDDNGNCIGGYGYCVREENVWQFRGESCPTEYASCITVKNSEKTVSYLRNTTDPGPCTEGNAGCQWYATQKTKQTDGSFAFPATNVLADDVAATTYNNRTYFTSQVATCDATGGGCKELVVRDSSLSLNMLVNPGLESDTDSNSQPDAWNFTVPTGSTWDATSAVSRTGASAVKTGTGIVYQPGVEFSQDRFYTMSFYARQASSGGTDAGDMYISFSADDGTAIDLTGTSMVAGDSSTCSFKDGNADGKMDAVDLTGTPTSTSYQRFTCTFTSPIQANPATKIFAFVDIMKSGVWVDDLQVEQGSKVTDFHDGYSSSNLNTEVVKVPPSYLGCTGASTDPAECANYALVCTENDAGCTAYTPANGDPVVTGVTSELDSCPATCVGYDTYKQEGFDTATNTGSRFEPNGSFPLYFIPDSATTCKAQDVGCDEFTNLSDESKAYFTYIRACVTPTQAAANTSSDNAATFYTWEGSDNAGYQLKTWNLLQSSLGVTPYTYTTSGGSDSAPSDAPCTEWTSTTDGIQCADTYAWADDSTCDEHADIFTNSNCREFYDVNGAIHYRDWSNTVTVDAACSTYRKTDIVGADATEKQATCTSSGGYYDSGAGTCRYFGLTSESNTCSASANGCRSYTGGRSRNSRVAFEDFLEGGDLTSWTAASASTVSLSNESLATGGHSISASAPFATYVGDNGSTCATTGGCVKTGGALGASCTVSNGKQYCGTLEGELFSGKTYTLTFEAKGSGTLAAGFDYQANAGAPAIDLTFGTSTLTSGWQQYSLGPLDLSNASALFGSGTALAFIPTGSAFVDNIVLREGQDSITLIKDSWVTPAACDETPTGAPSPQYYLGCQEYTTQDGTTADVKSFSKLCSEDKVGCASFFMTQESTSPHAEVHNATCETIGGGVALSATACYYGETGGSYDTTTPLLCTIGVGSNSCPFNLTWYVAPANLPAHIKYVPSTVITPADKDVFLVVKDANKCDTDVAGCTEYGLPTYNQDRTKTTGATSTYLMNDPSSYSTTLCTEDALYCSQWTGTDGTNYYFKDPIDKTCEYKTNVTVGGTSYDGWFRTGTSNFCYGTCTDGVTACSTDGDCGTGTCDATKPSYTIGGSTSGIWKNGDTKYGGWVGTCSTQYDSCSEYQDPLAIGTNEIYSNADGTPYFSLSSSLGTTSSSVTGVDCNGKVSLKSGCALFNDTSDSSKTYNSSATEISSRHADVLFNTAPFSLVDPIDCDNTSSAITTPSGDSVDLCARRCVYKESEVNDVTKSTSTAKIYGASCYTATDCAPVDSESGEHVTASSCSDDQTNRLKDDANTVLAVNRNRQCSQWLSCADAQTVWDERSNSYKTVCSATALCTKYSAQGNSSFCSKWNFENPKVVLDADQYTSRDVTWYGEEYSGMAIPKLFPVESLEQANVAPEKACDLQALHDAGAITDASYTSKNGASCSADSDCGGGAQYVGTCVANQTKDYRLVLNAGACTDSYGSACTVGTCANTGSSCATTSDCGTSGGSCLVGQCYKLDTASLCTSDAQCTGAGQTCNGGFCATAGSEIAVESYSSAAPNDSCDAGQTFVGKVGLKNGSCINSKCLLDTNGDAFTTDTAETKTCRAYPETASPFSANDVTKWYDPTNKIVVSTGTIPSDATPYSTVSGFDHANFCEYGQDCVCSYTKVTYGEGGQTKYFAEGYSAGRNGICSSGLKGKSCTSDDNCTDTSGSTPVTGTCTFPSREDSLLGMPGYCLQYDTAINVNGDRDQNACISWLPVDQLSGSSDLYGKSTEAGFFSTAYACVDTEPFVDLKISKFPETTATTGTIACAETKASGYSDITPDNAYDSSNMNACLTAAACPTGYWALIGMPAFNSHSGGFANACIGAGTLEVNDCPFVCVPLGATTPDGGSCDPTVSGGYVKQLLTDNSATFGYSSSTNKRYAVGHDTAGGTDLSGYAMFDNMVKSLDACVAKGVRYSDDLIAGVIKIASTSSTSPKDYRDLYPTWNPPYAACAKVAQTSDASGVQSYAWTDRMWSGSNYQISDTSVPNLEYKQTTVPVPFGFIGSSPLERSADAPPYVVAECVSLDEGEGYLADGSDLNSCSTSSTLDPVISIESPSNDPSKAEARSFVDFNILRSAGVVTSTLWTTNAGSFSSATAAIEGHVTQLFAALLKGSDTLGTWATSWGSTGAAALDYTMSDASSSSTFNDYDVRATDGSPPTIWAINPSTCNGSECEEGPADAITVNDQNTGDISSTQFLRASVKFYAAADKNQLPLRRMIVDWGDGSNDSGSDALDNFYKNHRGLQSNSTSSKCDLGTEWGETADSCDPNYITYSHIYTCPSSILLDSSKACGTPDSSGKYPSTPCVLNQGDVTQQECVYQPRVHTRDNWGWCTGKCTAGGDGTDGCYDGDGEIGTGNPDKDECLYTTYDRYGSTTDPWVYYDGQVIVKP